MTVLIKSYEMWFKKPLTGKLISLKCINYKRTLQHMKKKSHTIIQWDLYLECKISSTYENQLK